MNPAQLLNPKAFAKSKAKAKTPAGNKKAPNYGPRQSRKPIDPKLLLNPKGGPATASDAQDADNMATLAVANGTQEPGGLQAGDLIARLHNLTDRADAPTKKRKAEVIDADDADSEITKEKSTFNGNSNGGIISDHLKEERKKMTPDEHPVTSSAAIDLTKEDDDDVQIIEEIRKPSDEVCAGILHATINADRVPYASPASMRNVPKDFWPPIKVHLMERPSTMHRTSIFSLKDRAGKKFGNLEVRVANVLGPIIEGSAMNKIRFMIMLPARKRLPGEEVGQAISQCLKAEIAVFIERLRVHAFGTYLSQRNFFLSPPRFDPKVEVVNPHVPSVYGPIRDSVKTVKSSKPTSISHVTRTAEQMTRDANDMFDIIAKDVIMPEMDADGRYITTELMSHQRQALKFLTQHEDIEDVENQAGAKSSLWKYQPRDNGRRAWYHVVTGDEVFEKPDTFQGGILADVMGLGKTLNILALIANTVDEAKRFRLKEAPGDLDVDCNARGTLIICPKSVLTNWEEQIVDHVKPGRFRVYAYHGSSRLQDTHQLGKFDIVLTTYNTAAAELSEQGRPKRALALINWFRIVLDEAHQIRNTASKVFKACCVLHAQRRWAVTGTPVQNSLNDLGALLQFLRFTPFEDKTKWAQYIMAPFKNSDTNVIQQLQILVSSITLRRLKDKVDLPERNESVIRLDPTNAELELYQKFSKKYGTDLRVREDKDGNFKGKAFSYVLKCIGVLRAIAAHGEEMLSEDTMNDIRDDKDNDDIKMIALGDEHDAERGHDFGTEDQAYEHLKMLQDYGINKCMCCEDPVGRRETEIIDLDSDDEDDEVSEETSASPDAQTGDKDIIGWLTPCLHLIDQKCKHKTDQYQPNVSADGHFKCPQCGDYKLTGLFELRYSTQKRLSELKLSTQPRGGRWNASTYRGPHTKVKALIEDLKISAKETESLGPDEPPIRSVVFSGWTTYLDLIEYAIAREGFQFVRLDGTMSVRARTAVLEKFKTDRAITVLLVSIKAGGQGLNFTAANKAYVMEPQFNPGVEAQAVDRIHRMGQTREVFITHYILNHSIEEGILLLQRKKERLAEMSMERKRTRAEDNKMRMEELKALFK